MSISSVNNGYIIAPNTNQTEDDPTALNQDDFMDLLLAQLQNQDPLEPMSDTEFISQMAEFSALEEMQNMNASLNTMQSLNMIGKTITYNDGNGNVKTALVETVTISGGKTYFEVDGVNIDAASVISVSEGGA